jgi:sugar/nucleoside kinase (ribokinase family)
MAFDDLQLPTTTQTNVVGGSATYAALSASFFGSPRVVAVVGTDFPDSALSDLGTRGVDVSGIERAEGKTFRWVGRYAENLSSRVTLDTQLNVFESFQPVLPDAFKDSEILFLGNIHPKLQLDVLDQMKGPRLVAADTMNFWIEREREALLRVLGRIDVLIINDEEVRQLSGLHNLRRAAAAVRGLGPKRLIVKRGEYGAMLFDDRGIFFSPAYPLEDEIDPTGAGDSFAGALLGALSADGELDAQSFRRALMLGGAVASFCVEDVGPKRLFSLTRDEIAARLDTLRSLVHFSH